MDRTHGVQQQDPKETTKQERKKRTFIGLHGDD